MQWVMGLGGSNHDFSACLLQGGAHHRSIEDERLTYKRYGDNHWASAPCRPSANYCLASAGLELGDLDGLFVSNDIEGHNRFWEQRSHTIVGHHLCHASAAYYASPFDEAALLVVDGRGGPVSSIVDGRRTFETISIGVAAGSSLELETVQTGEHQVSTSTWRYISSNSIGWFYSIVTECVGMGENGEGKTMALAAFGEARFKKELLQFVTLGGEQLFEMDPYSGLWSFLVDTVVAADRSFAVRADLAASAQSILEDVLVAATQRLRRQSTKRYLAFGGGVALNGVANRRIREQSGFDDLFVFPASGDNGLSVGAALYGYHHLGGHPVRNRSMARSVSFAFGGRCYSEEEMEEAARAFAVSVQRSASEDDLVERLTTALLNGSVVALFQDGSEFGPRALGNRSLIALPGTPNIQRRLNRIKHRESFRPFAPIVPEEEADVYFEAAAPSPFMLEMAPIRKSYREALAGAAHVDGSARLQTIGPYQQGLVRSLLQSLKRRGRPPVIINTSFNLKGQPIVEQPRDAMTAFVHLDVEALVMGPFWIEKHTPLAANEKGPQHVP
jgi:carbamoyltransferase